MFRPRIIPVLLLKDGALVKSTRFTDYRYLGDPLNAVKIYNEFKADELVFLDIEATKKSRCISLSLVQEIADEANMPFAVGGGIQSIAEIENLLSAGAEKIVLGASAVLRPDFVRQASETFGAATIVVCIDVKRHFFKGQKLFLNDGGTPPQESPVEFALRIEQLGAGELIVQSVDRDGTMSGYDLELIRSVADAVQIPVVALGGAGSLSDLKRAYQEGHANGLAAGSLFVFHGAKKGVLMSYPNRAEKTL